MTPFEYVSVLLSIVISLALTHLMIGITRIIKAGVSRWSIPLVGWIGFMAFMCVDYWFSVWHARNDPVWSLGFICFLLLLGAVLFVNCWMIVPEVEVNEPVDLAAHHAAIRRKFLTGLFFYLILGHLANLMLAGFQSSTVKLLGIAQIGLIVTAWMFESARIQLGVIAAMYLLTAWYALNFIPAL
ncbi:MAG: hypothetical protein OEW50_07425 [Gammaproteobacteria bacterium]|nr:hypothetical protein [Gammaproteobacteria bacterium]MDH5176012.1 hypothetical protein [Gammaproteobacteria bacterium]MDH5227217.1 hypothetical protein [Gammaproteobacteria bacterium]